MTKQYEIRVLAVVKILIAILIGVLSLAGFAAYSFNFQLKKFLPSRPMLFYAVIVIGAFSLIYTQRIIEEYTANQFELNNAEKLYTYLTIISAFVSFLNSLFLTNRMLHFLNNVQLFKLISFFYLDDAIIRFSLLIIILKIFAFPIAFETTLIIRQMRNEPDKPIVWTIYTLLPWILANISPNCFFGALVVNKQLLLVLNKSIKSIEKEVNSLQTKLQMELQKSYYRMQRFCDLADKLDILSIKYTIICDQSLEFIDLLAAPFICSLICNLFGITAGLFAHYHAIADSLINEESFDTFNAITSSVFLIISISEIALQAHLSNENLVVAKETGHILQRMNLLHADVRFKESVESFSLLIFVKKYKIEPWGLLEINVSLLHDVLSAVTSFLLILIQTDLALRFSLK